MEERIVNETNNLIRLKNKPRYLINYIKTVYNYIMNNNKFISDTENDNIELSYEVNKQKEISEYYRLLNDCLYFLNYFEVSNFKYGYFYIEFMRWFLDHSEELNRRLTLTEFLSLESKFRLCDIFNKKVDSFKQLYDYDNLEKFKK